LADSISSSHWTAFDGEPLSHIHVPHLSLNLNHIMFI